MVVHAGDLGVPPWATLALRPCGAWTAWRSKRLIRCRDREPGPRRGQNMFTRTEFPGLWADTCTSLPVSISSLHSFQTRELPRRPARVCGLQRAANGLQLPWLPAPCCLVAVLVTGNHGLRLPARTGVSKYMCFLEKILKLILREREEGRGSERNLDRPLAAHRTRHGAETLPGINRQRRQRPPSRATRATETFAMKPSATAQATKTAPDEGTWWRCLFRQI